MNNQLAKTIPLISICIPAYKNIVHLERLLVSIAKQTFTNYEVIITDDTPDETIKLFLDKYTDIQNLCYFRNDPTLGTPENWNEAIRKSNGTWIKLMHSDDWFATEDALEKFYQASQQNPECFFFFSAFQNVVEETGAKQVVRCNAFDLFVLKLNPLHLFRRVYVGNPSCTFIKKDVGLLYDKQFKFVVDFEYYIRSFWKLKLWHYIDDVLLNIGFHNEQVTKYTFLNPAVQIPENYDMLQKLGTRILRNLLVYDYYWRMHRNLKVRSLNDVAAYYSKPVHPFIKRMILFQSKIPQGLLSIGIVSKTLMLLHYVTSRFHSIEN
jgi:glycosyltransferase involved in cell wall biosynthesis